MRSPWYAPAPSGRAVLLLPGAGSSRDGVVDHLAVLHDGDYGVLALDPRGHGHSTGRGMDWGWYGEADVGAAVSYLHGSRGQPAPAGATARLPHPPDQSN